jgi:HEAT repeat protein
MGYPAERPEFASMSTAELFASARIEVPEDDPDDRCPHLVALHERPTREVFDTAVRLLSGELPGTRELGARVLRELGRQGELGRRPFSAEAVPVLVDRLDQERDPDVLRWLISALGYNAAREALRDVLRFVGHPDWRVRFRIASALPALVDPAQVEPEAVNALQRLCRDEEADTRWYALYALLKEVTGADPERVAETVAHLVNDPDEQIRELAREGRTRSGAET